MGSQKKSKATDLSQVNKIIASLITKIIVRRFKEKKSSIKNLSQLSLALGKDKTGLSSALNKKDSIINIRLLFQIASLIECSVTDLLPKMDEYLNIVEEDNRTHIMKADYLYKEQELRGDDANV